MSSAVAVGAPREELSWERGRGVQDSTCVDWDENCEGCSDSTKIKSR